MKKYISIDLETTGLDEDRHQILAFAAVVGNFDSTYSVNELPSFQRFFYYPEIVGNSTALAMNVDILRDMEAGSRQSTRGMWLTINELMADFRAWLTGVGFPVGEKISVTGKNFASFDARFLKQVKNFEIRLFHHRVLDPGSLYFESDLDEVLPALAMCMERAGLRPEDWKLHTALDDAKVVVELIRRYYCNYRLSGALAYNQRNSPMLSAADARHIMTLTGKSLMDESVRTAALSGHSHCQIQGCSVEHLHTALKSGYDAKLEQTKLSLNW